MSDDMLDIAHGSHSRLQLHLHMQFSEFTQLSTAGVSSDDLTGGGKQALRSPDFVCLTTPAIRKANLLQAITTLGLECLPGEYNASLLLQAQTAWQPGLHCRRSSSAYDLFHWAGMTASDHAHWMRLTCFQNVWTLALPCEFLEQAA